MISMPIYSVRRYVMLKNLHNCACQRIGILITLDIKLATFLLKY